MSEEHVAPTRDKPPVYLSENSRSGMVMGLPGYLAVVQRQISGVWLPCNIGGVGMVSLHVAWRSSLRGLSRHWARQERALHSLRAMLSLCLRLWAKHTAKAGESQYTKVKNCL